MDIRGADDFAAGHIENAVNVAAADVLSHIEDADLTGYDEVSIVCYTGQTAGWATCLLRLMGWEHVYSMMFGMCSWNADFAERWNTHISNGGANYFTTDATDKGAAGNLPSLSTGKETGQEILESRMATVLSEGFTEAKISNGDVYANPDNYYVINYWPATEYANPGHLEGAMQYTPKESMKLSADLKTLPNNKTVVVYCYTGQNSANLTAYLRVIGYDAKSLLYGTNDMIYDQMTTSKWSEAAIKGYDYVISK